MFPIRANKIAITQPNYIPWHGWFSLVSSVDTLVILDTVQYTKRDWRNRNRINAHGVPKWLTIPISTSSKYHQKIYEATIESSLWATSHFSILKSAYKEFPYWNTISDDLFDLYIESEKTDSLVKVDMLFTNWIMKNLNINIDVDYASNCSSSSTDPNLRLLEICMEKNAHTYVSAPSAKEYLNENLFQSNKLIVEWFDYSRLGSEYEVEFSIIDLICRVGWSRTTEIVLRS
jgi:hypothetical protein